MKKLLFLITLSLAAVGCNGQKSNDLKISKQPAATDTLHTPKTDIRVNKKYDEKGNLISYDSTYSYFYSSPGLKHQSINSDSLFDNFKIPLRDDYKGLLNDNMNNVFFNDSLFKYDFYNNDYFSKRFQLNMKHFEKMFWQMDSIKTDMLNQNYPNGKIKQDN